MARKRAKDSACLRVLQILRMYKRGGIHSGVSAIRLSLPGCGGLSFHRRIGNLRSGEYDGVRRKIDAVPIRGKRYCAYILRREGV